MTEREKFVARFDSKLGKGLVDVKFFVNDADGLSLDRLFAAANRMDDVVEAGKSRAHTKFQEEFTQADIREILS